MAKKHDRWTHLSNLTQHYHQTLQKKWPIETDMAHQLDQVVVRISYANVTCEEGIAGPLPPPRSSSSPTTLYNDQTAFERATTKYWVHPDNVTEVKSIILFHLPVHIYNKEKQYEAKDAAISSVYFDNSNFDLYTERLERTKGAEAIRFRWYGQETDSIYVERKTHHAEWLDGNSVKDRFMLNEKEVDAFVQGSYTADAIVADMRARNNNKTKNNPNDEDTLQHQHFVAKGVEKSFRERHLEPMCRVYYNRTAFQRPNDQRLRISLDCNLTFIREDQLDGKVRRPHNKWHRTDVKIDHPFHHVHPRDIHHFPYAVLETKIQTHLGQKVPAWLQALLSSHLVYEVPRFSKYLHGASHMFRDQVPVLPWWLEELDKDIRKPPVFGVGLSRSLSLQPLVNGHHRRSLFQPSSAAAQPQHVSINLMGDAKKGAAAATTTTRKKSLMMAATGRAKDDDKKGGNGDLLSRFYPKLVDSGKKFISNKETPSSQQQQQLPRPISQRMMKRTEPKTFFANERTFISWLQFCALLLTVALNLLNHGDHISRVIGAVFIIMASVLCFYALGRYQFRAYQLRTGRFITRYDDLYGPTILCICLVTALIVNFYLRLPAITQQSTITPPPPPSS
ncbi:VTC domain-containing protein [Zychaea mexicana]|uniref:VTC domain-containing protein n=1 Tax=Zychaea mexicana TaxID=64656 RepID=UPI0022FF17BE|nr:VTC domain-containing protein [Zychaea mexicana]KAI9493341.1 VTC domain-containing protein [Zychaea mexicana]